MSLKTFIHAGLTLAGLMIVETASAGTTNFTARFDAALDSDNNRFVDTTLSTPCPFPVFQAWCASRRLINLEFGYPRFAAPVSPNTRFPDVRLPGAERILVVIGDNGQSHELRFRFTEIAQVLVNAGNIADYEGLANPSGNCSGGVATDYGGGARNFFMHAWSVRAADGDCYAFYRGATETVYPPLVDSLYATYSLITPNPSVMHPGIYTGTLSYSAGNGSVPGDFQFHGARDGSDTLTINFTLTVSHDLKVDFPGSAIGEQVVAYLEPPGGWSAWQGRGTPPPQLSREVPFRISMTGPLKMSMECEYYAGATCGIKNSAGPEIEPIEVAVSIPGVDLVAGGQVVKVPLPTDSSGAIKMVPGRVLHGQRASVHFRTDAAATARIAAVEGARYEGIVTLVYDAAP